MKRLATRSTALSKTPRSTAGRDDRERDIGDIGDIADIADIAAVAGRATAATRRRARTPHRNALRFMSLPFPGQVSGTAATAGHACLYQKC
jgi:hypothetical protein